MPSETYLPVNIGSVVTPDVVQRIGLTNRKTVALLFTRLAMDSQASRADRFSGFELPDTRQDCNAFVQYCIDRGIYDALRNEFASRYIEADESTIDELALFSIWRTFYLFPWRQAGIDESRVIGYIRKTMHFLLRVDRQNNSGSGRKADLSDACDNYASDDRSNIRPVENDIAGREAFHTTQMGMIAVGGSRIGSDRQTAYFELIASGYSQSEAAQLLQLNPHEVAVWMKLIREANPDECIGRVDQTQSGNWAWTPHTAHVLLSTDMYSLLSERQRKVLETVALSSSLEEAAHILAMSKPSLQTVLSQVKVIVQSGGAKTRLNQQSRIDMGRNTLAFLREVQINTEFDRTVVESLVAANGRITEAAQLMGSKPYVVSNWLQRKGYYKG